MYGVSMPSVNGYRDSLNSALPSWMTLTRGAGSWSYQSAAAADGTTFIVLGTAENTGRFNYHATAARRMLVIEPTRANLVPTANFVDTAPANDIPDGWSSSSGTPNVDFRVDDATGPHGGAAWHRMNTGVTANCTRASAIADPGTYVASAWVKASGLGAGQVLYTWGRLGVWANSIALTAGTYAWTRQASAATATPGTAGDNVYIQNGVNPGGAFDVSLPQLEAGSYASTFANGTRAAELCALNASVVGASSGHVSFLWSPLWANNTFAGVATLFEWAPNWRLDYDGADDKFKVVVNGTNRAESAAQTFSSGALIRLSVRYGAAGQELTVDQSGVGAATTSNATAWGSPALAPYLGSRAASANCESAHYADLLLAA